VTLARDSATPTVPDLASDSSLCLISVYQTPASKTSHRQLTIKVDKSCTNDRETKLGIGFTVNDKHLDNIFLSLLPSFLA
jgi:hypothetical protein